MPPSASPLDSGLIEGIWRERERIKEGKLIKNTTGRKREVDEEHMLIHRDNPVERGRAASQLVIGTVDEAHSGRQMALMAWKCWGGWNVEG